MNRNIKTLYFSATGTTKAVVNSIAEGISPTFKEYSITLPHERVGGLEFAADDLVIAGIPVYAGRVPYFVEEYLSKVKGKNTALVCVVLYGNREYEDALIELRNKLECRGFVTIGAGAFIGEHSYTEKIAKGRPNESDLQVAKNFGQKIRRKLEKEKSSLESLKVSVAGNYPYKDRPIITGVSPDTRDTCRNCGLCAKNCPVGAIDLVDFKKSDPNKCVKCNSCIKGCPLGAKYFSDSGYIDFREDLIRRVAEKKSQIETVI